jgi:hypothetical protein
MSDWRGIILKHFVPGVRRVTAVADADGILRDPGVFRAIEERGFSLLQFEDSISFRFDYETRFRPRWDAGESIEIVVVFKPGERDFEMLPADVLAQARRLSFTLKDVFPKLSYGVVSQLETVHFEALYLAQMQYADNALGDALTKEFILQHVFQIVPSLVTKDSDLLRLLCQKHCKETALPEALDLHLVRVLRQRPIFQAWPLEILIRDRKAYWEFVNERWPVFVRETGGGTSVVREGRETLKYSGPSLLPFQHDDVRAFIETLFEDGTLTPIPWSWDHAVPEIWIRVGLIGSGTENAELRFEELTNELVQACPDGGSTPQSWTAFAHRYGQARLLWTEIGSPAREKNHELFTRLCQRVNELFNEWLKVGYPGIFNYPTVTPLMVHHLPGYLAYCLSKSPKRKLALVLFDGMSIEQWLVIKEELRRQAFAPIFREGALFAWLPSITPISRQAAYSGKIPRYFAESIHQTNRDETRWRQFWADRGYNSSEAGFVSMEGDPGDEDALAEPDLSSLRVLGVTIRKVDKIMHGMRLGSIGMIGQVRTWAQEGFVRNLFEKLVAADFDVLVTADHGNSEAAGIGTPQEGVLSDKRGHRCRIYTESTLRANALAKIEGSTPWEHSGLPPNLYVLLARYGDAFAQKGIKIVCHGGASVEEVIVPFAQLSDTN